jgi:hypothetical protein
VRMGSVCHIANLVGGGVEAADFRVCKVRAASCVQINQPTRRIYLSALLPVI